MKRIIIDGELRERFENFEDDFELCDDQGQVVAVLERAQWWVEPDRWDALPTLDDEGWSPAEDSGVDKIPTHVLVNKLRTLKMGK